MSVASRFGSTCVVDADGLQRLIGILIADGREVIGPQVAQGAIVLAPIGGLEDLPVGFHDEQAPGRYRLTRSDDGELFGYASSPFAWKRFLFPPTELLWRARRRGQGFGMEQPSTDEPKRAFFGVRACDLHAIAILDGVLGPGHAADAAYGRRRGGSLIVAVNCARPASTCFCVSMQAGPGVDEGYDVLLTEVMDGKRHDFVAAGGSSVGERLLAQLPSRPATDDDLTAAETVVAAAAHRMERHMPADVRGLLRDNLEHRQWNEVAERCLACGNCTAVCPTCFCSSIEDTLDISGTVAERWRRSDSCFTLQFSHVHGGSIRRGGAARYRQWMTHKLSYWHEQFGRSGCVGCGRCITWCPVGIDITAEAKIIRDTTGETRS